MLYIIYLLDILLLLAIPIALGIFLTRKLYLEGRWWWNGAIVFILSKIIQLPLQNYIINPYLNNLSYSGVQPSIIVLLFGGLVIGLSTGVCEELLRYAMFCWWTRDARTFESALLLGTGHGGAASIALGILVLYNFLNMAVLRNKDLTGLTSADQVQMLQSQISAFWSVGWLYALREVLGQISMLIIQISLAVMILQAFIRKQWYWVVLAIGYHTLVEFSRIIVLNLSNELLANGVLGFFALGGILIILAFRCVKDIRPLSSNVMDQSSQRQVSQ